MLISSFILLSNYLYNYVIYNNLFRTAHALHTCNEGSKFLVYEFVLFFAVAQTNPSISLQFGYSYCFFRSASFPIVFHLYFPYIFTGFSVGFRIKYLNHFNWCFSILLLTSSASNSYLMTSFLALFFLVAHLKFLLLVFYFSVLLLILSKISMSTYIDLYTDILLFLLSFLFSIKLFQSIS